MPRTGGTGGTSRPSITKLQFRLLALGAFCLFVVSVIFSIDTHPTGQTIHELSGPNTPIDWIQPLILGALIVTCLGVVVGYAAILFFSRWARWTVLLSATLMAAAHLLTPADSRSGGAWAPLAASFYIATLVVIAISFSAASGLFEAKPDA